MEQIRNIVVEAANAKVPLQREKKTKKLKEPKLDVKLDEPPPQPIQVEPELPAPVELASVPEPKAKRVQSENRRQRLYCCNKKEKNKLKNKTY